MTNHLSFPLLSYLSARSPWKPVETRREHCGIPSGPPRLLPRGNPQTLAIAYTRTHKWRGIRIACVALAHAHLSLILKMQHCVRAKGAPSYVTAIGEYFPQLFRRLKKRWPPACRYTRGGKNEAVSESGIWLELSTFVLSRMDLFSATKRDTPTRPRQRWKQRPTQHKQTITFFFYLF